MILKDAVGCTSSGVVAAIRLCRMTFNEPCLEISPGSIDGKLSCVFLYVDAIAAVVAQCSAGANVTDLCDTGDNFMNECVGFLYYVSRKTCFHCHVSMYAGLLPRNSREKILKRVLQCQHVSL